MHILFRSRALCYTYAMNQSSFHKQQPKNASSRFGAITRIKRGLAFILCALCSLLSACTVIPASNDAAAYAPGEEKRLIVYTSHKSEVYGSIIKEFEDRYDIFVSVQSGGTNELLERIATESGRPSCDIMFGGGVESLESFKQYFTPYRCAQTEAIDPAFRSLDASWTPFSSLPIVLIYNTKLVAQDEVQGWKDLLDPRWKGRIAFADPSISGSSFTSLSTLLQVLPNEENVLSRFAANLDGKQLEGSGEVVSSIVDGTYLLGVTLEETALRHRAAGEDIALVYPQEGTSAVPDGCAMIQNAPHEKNAKLFLDFIVSRDVQNRVVDSLQRRSVRSDVDVAAWLVSSNDIHLIPYDLSWASQNHDMLLITWSSFFSKETAK